MSFNYTRTSFIKILLSTILFSSASAYAENKLCQKDYEDIISSEITQISTALNQGNYSYILEKSDPSIIELSGGIESYNAILSLAANSFKQGGIQVDKVALLPPQNSHIFGKKEFCVIPKQLTIVMNGKPIIGEQSFMLAVRPLDSKEWKYIDGTGLKKNPDMLYTLFSEIPSSQNILTN